MLHSFTQPISHIVLPEKFTYPFQYTPHPLCVMAAEEVQRYLQNRLDWQKELQLGKMFGVLVVQSKAEQTGFLAAFSGILAGENVHSYFVPPVYDLLQPEGFFKVEEQKISAINTEIKELEGNESFLQCRQAFTDQNLLAQSALAKMKAEIKEAKENREKRRRENNLSESELADLIKESQYQKAEFKRLERIWKERLASLQKEVEIFTRQIESLKTERKTRSAVLQQHLFAQFHMMNANGESKDLCALFEQTAQRVPPAGAGECAAPKLLQYAFLNDLKPIAMAEFWWGDSPKAEVRHHGFYYPACKGKCEPILKHMLQGLEVEDNPLFNHSNKKRELEKVYEDDFLLIINKPAGMLSVPGKEMTESVYDWVRINYPDATGPLVVHRLDMATSGLLLIAKSKEVHQNLQAQFEDRTIKKCYTALLDGIITEEKGTINLPLCLDPLDRPRQIVNETYGKSAITDFEVLKRSKGYTRIAFFPQTGRTHQLRVHAAHPRGLNCPILGDTLYGKEANRLYLHAEALTFEHPILGKVIKVEKKAEF